MILIAHAKSQKPVIGILIGIFIGIFIGVLIDILTFFYVD